MHNSGESRRGIADAHVKLFWLFENRIPGNSLRTNAPHHASSPRTRGPITTGISGARKSSNSVSQNKRGGDDSERRSRMSERDIRDRRQTPPVILQGKTGMAPCKLVNATVTSLVYTLPTISLAS
jgi:hypothetical protein